MNFFNLYGVSKKKLPRSFFKDIHDEQNSSSECRFKLQLFSESVNTKTNGDVTAGRYKLSLILLLHSRNCTRAFTTSTTSPIFIVFSSLRTYFFFGNNTIICLTIFFAVEFSGKFIAINFAKIGNITNFPPSIS